MFCCVVFAYFYKFSFQILLEGYVEIWMSKILSEIKNSVKNLLSTSIQKLDSGVPFEEILLNSPAQIGVICFYYHFTKECERSVMFLRSDRKALTNLAKKFSGLSNRLCYMLSRGVYRPMNVNLSKTQKMRVENVLGVSKINGLAFVYLRLPLSTIITRVSHFLLKNLSSMLTRYEFQNNDWAKQANKTNIL